MNNRKNTRRALFASVISMLLCVTMLVGSTFAWFTDNASTNVNSIVAGTLDIGLYSDENCTTSIEGQTISFVKAGENALWEPGSTWSLPTVYIKNNGNLAVKYIVEVTGINGDAELNEVINWTITDGTELAEGAEQAEGKLGVGEKKSITISGHMAESAGNKYMGKSITGIAITVRATQDTVEYDSTNNTYDADAQYQMPLAEADELVELFEAAAANGGSDVVINLDQDYDASSWTGSNPTGYNGTKNVTINGNGHTIYNLSTPLMIGSFAGSGNITINDLTIADANISGFYNGLGNGAFLAYCDASGSVTLNKCNLVASTVDCTGGVAAAGLVGYSSGASVTFTDCTVTGSTVKSVSNAAGFIGYTTAPVTVSGGSVSGSTFVSTDNGAWRIGAIGGTFNTDSCVVTVSGFTQSGNSFTQASASTSQESELYGRVISGAAFN